MPNLRVLDPEPLAQRDRLREVACRHTNFVPVSLQQLDHRPHHQHVRAVRQVDPNAHRRHGIGARRGRAPG
jgi:hypothetical protein